MKSRALRTFAAFLILAVALASPAWAKYDVLPADGVPWDFPESKRVVAVGDIHGDATAMITILEKTNLIDSSGRWIGGKTHLVFTGDLNDRGKDTRIIFDLIMSLEKQSEAAGGRVDTLLGNHDVLTVEGQTFYAHPEESRLFGHPLSPKPPGSHDAMLRAVQGDGPYAKWLRSRNTMIRVGDTLFVHAGVEDWSKSVSPGKINATVRAWVASLQGAGRTPPESTKWVLKGRKAGEAVDVLEGPLWTRKIGKGLLTDAELNELLAHIGVKRIVIGHTAANKPIRSQYGGRVQNIDTGISKEHGGVLSALEFHDGQMTPHEFDRPSGEHALVKAYRRAWEESQPLNFPMKSVSCLARIANFFKGGSGAPKFSSPQL